MSRPTLYVTITNHGFGHAVRAASVVAELQKLSPEMLIILVTTAPRWLLESYITGDFIHRPRAFDIGVIQSDSLTMDLPGTFTKLTEIKQRQQQIVSAEVNFIKQNQVDLILADIPFLAAEIGKAAGIPGWMMSNFGWDFIYEAWGEKYSDIVAWIRDSYAKSDRLFRLPLHESMNSFSAITDVGLTGGNPKYNETHLRQTFNINSSVEKTILLSFGGLGLDAIPYQNLARFPDWQFITFDANAPILNNLIKITNRDYRPVDFMPICDRVISKPGYSTFAEALKLNVPIVSLTRSGFAETPLLLAGIQDYAYHQILSPDVFFNGSWEFLEQPLQPPRLSTTLPKNGSEAIATEIVTYLNAS
ncbi:glycosyl transferase [Merismopedia glauca]|uniref:Glycosyl transferase n=1 Tax=Merismopedia glauca CCAP 1448/3 TaxID=1296344 RepID=A0A2T1C2F8_9CYAN|nr:glycosyl transferase [Merismopedia glauca]PSB02432.1 glycosyl transferase [Merismopedia glauca CCAP 1448/3]